MTETDRQTERPTGADAPTASSPAIAVDGVSKRFGDTLAVDDASFTVRRGDIAAFLGPNGSGKTTLVRLLNGVLGPTSGEVSVLGHDVTETPLPVQRRSGVVTESLSLYERFSGRYNLRFYGRLYDVPDDATSTRIEALSELLELRSYLDDPVETYSTGMKKRLLLARALLHDPDVLFLDEPTSGLDPQAARMVVDHVDAISREEDVTVFLCTHDLQVAERLATRIFFLDDGEIVATGTPTELRSELWPAVTVEVTLDGWSASIADDLAAAPWVHDLDPDVERSDVPDTSVVRVELASRDAIPKLVDQLVDAGGRLYRLDEDRHSLEDIYFRVREEVR
jgi:ABC-2 type transport system ATP-binding protein